MIRLILYLILVLPKALFCQTYNEMGVKFLIKDSIMIIENIDKKYKIIKIFEKEYFQIGEINRASNYQFEGYVVENHRFYIKKGVIEIISDRLKKQFTLTRK